MMNFCATGKFTAAAGVLPFLYFSGNANNNTLLRRIILSNLNLTAAQYLRAAVAKNSAGPTGGVSVAPTKVNINGTGGNVSINTLVHYTTAPTFGTIIGDIASRTVLAQATAPSGANQPTEIDFDWRTNPVWLVGAAPCVVLYFPVAPATAVDLTYYFEWSETA